MIVKTKEIYLAGGMGKFGVENFKEGNEWRERCKFVLEDYEGTYRAHVINPNDYFNFKDNPPRYRTEREIMEFDLNKVRHADLIIVNFNDMHSLGTMAEIAIAYEIGIPVIGVDEEGQRLHPWQIEMCNRIFRNMSEMLCYIQEFYLT